MANIPCNVGDVTSDCKICVVEWYFDHDACQLAYRQTMETLNANPAYSQKEKERQARQACEAVANRTKTKLMSYDTIYSCSQCSPDDGKRKVIGNVIDDPNVFRIRNVYSTNEALRMSLKECKDCEEEIIPGTNPSRYKAKFTGGVAPNSCDTCEQIRAQDGELEGKIITDGLCKKKNKENNDPRYRWDAVYIGGPNGKCECVRRCEECYKCQQCVRENTVQSKETCVDNCEEGRSFVCASDGSGDYECYCKFKPWADGKQEKPYVQCGANTPDVIYNDDLSCKCGCLCEGTNVVCATSTDDNGVKSFIGCKCKYVDNYNEDASGTTPYMKTLDEAAGYPGFFNEITPCNESAIVETDDGGCTCGYVFEDQGLPHNLLP